MKRLYAFASMAALATAAFAPPSDQGGAAPDPIGKSDPAPAPLSADQVKPAEPAPEPSTGAAGNAPGGDPNPPANAKKAKAAAKSAAKAQPEAKPAKSAPANPLVMVWVQPGHEKFGIGKMIRTPAEVGENLRSAGRARYASEAEIEAAGEDIADVESV